MNVGVIPKAAYFEFITPEHLDTLVGAGGTADVQQCFHNITGSILPLKANHFNQDFNKNTKKSYSNPGFPVIR